jgi:hypothetical protein
MVAIPEIGDILSLDHPNGIDSVRFLADNCGCRMNGILVL